MQYDLCVVSLKDHLKKASKAQKEKHKDSLSEWGKKSVKVRFKGKTKEEISLYFRNIRKGKKVD